MDSSPRVTVLGIGAIGYGMAVSLLRAGLDTTVWNRTRSKAEPLGALGAKVADDAASAAHGANARHRSERPGMNRFGPPMRPGTSSRGTVTASGGTYRSRNTRTTASSSAPAIIRKPA